MKSVRDVLEGLFQRKLARSLRSVKKIPGGFNCALYRVVDDHGQDYMAKQYTHADKLNRLRVEYRSFVFLWKHGVQRIAQPIVQSLPEALGVYRFVHGHPIPKGTYSRGDLLQVVAFWRQLHALTCAPDARKLPKAKDACFCVSQYYESIARRVGRLARLPDDCGYPRLQAFLGNEFALLYKQVKQVIAESGTNPHEIVPIKHRTLSPSDFGFHNALRGTDGVITFVDFEYFGWDDPAKLVADFFLHPNMEIPYQARTFFFNHIAPVIREDRAFGKRLALVYLLQSLRWVLIMLNVFLRQKGDSPRAVIQLGKAEAFVQRTRAELKEKPFPLTLLT